MYCKFKKVFAGCIIGIGLGILLVLILPPAAWITIVSIAMIIYGVKKIFFSK